MNNNKRTLALAMALVFGITGCATAGDYRYADYGYDDYYDYPGSSHKFTDSAKVLQVKPIYDTVSVNRPETRCWNEQVRHHRPSASDSYTPTIAGAILGGVIGNQFGGGHGKDAMTAAGLLLGGSLGNDYRKNTGRPHSYTTTEKRCETIDNYHETNELVGYNVKYKYRGQQYWTRMPNDPGEYIKVNVTVEPAEY